MFRAILTLSVFVLSSIAPSLVLGQQPVYYTGPQLLGRSLGEMDQGNVYITLFFPPHDLTFLMSRAQQVLGGSSPLSNSQLTQYFSPSPSKFYDVLSFMESKGFTPVYLSPGRFSIVLSGPVGAVDQLFGVKLYLYQYGGIVYYRPDGVPRIPNQLYGLEIGGLTNFTTFLPDHLILGALNRSSLFQVHRPYSLTLYGLHLSFSYYTPQVLQGAYNVTPLLKAGGGKGQTVAIIDAYGDPEIYQDLQAFDSKFHLPPVNLSVIPLGPYNPGLGLSTGWDVETALDVEAVHSMAPNAKIDLIVVPVPTADFLFIAVDLVVSEGLANVTTMSFGEPENLFGGSGFFSAGFVNYPLADYYFALGVAEGMQFFASSGDQGAFDTTPTFYGGPSFPASSPFVSAVGGTTLFVNVTSGSLSSMEANATYGREIAWSVTPSYINYTLSSGGGVSTLFPKPWYQSVIGGSTREVPDVAADANPFTGFPVIVEGQTLIVGGTSLASPLWAGMYADLNAYLKRDLGFLNPYIYSIYRNSTLYSKAFHRVSFGYNGEYYANDSYNLVTGLGSPNLGNLAQALSQLLSKPQLKVTVTVYSPADPFYPQYDYNTTFQVSASVTYPNGTTVKSGDFKAYLYTLRGYLSSMNLKFNGSYWVGYYTIPSNSPLNAWEVLVNGSSGVLTGSGATDIYVGNSIGILLPVPYPYAPPIPPNTPFFVAIVATYPNGTPISNGSFTAHFIRDGKQFFSVKLIPAGIQQGVYAASYALLTPLPQGTYVLVINGTGSQAYTYLYFGEEIRGAVLTPVLGALPSASPGETVTLLSLTRAGGGGVYTSNVTAYLYSQDGKLMASVPLTAAPNALQLGIFNFFNLSEGNFTIPSNFPPGFYTVVFSSVYNSSAGLQYGNFTTSFYVSPSNLSSYVISQRDVFQGQELRIYANVTYPNGTPVTSGVFTATVEPVELSYASIELESFTGVPMQYNSTLGLWEASVAIPSILNGSFYQGSPQYFLVGPWRVVISGESGEAMNGVSFNTVFVMPYTYIGPINVSSLHLGNIPLLYRNGSSLYLSQVYSPNLRVQGVNLVISSSFLGNLTVENSTVVIYGSTIRGTVNALNSNLTLMGSTVEDSVLGIRAVNSNLTLTSVKLLNLGYAFEQVNSNITMVSTSMVGVRNVSVIPPPSFQLISPIHVASPFQLLNLSVKGNDLRVLSVSLGGERVTALVRRAGNTTLILVPFNATSLPDGVYTLNITVSNGLVYTNSFLIYNVYHSSSLTESAQRFVHQVFNALQASYVSLGISLITLGAFLYFGYRRGLFGGGKP